MKTHRSPRRRAPGFSLVELLVTLTIVMVLAGVVVTITSRTKKSATSVRTLANLREIGACAGLWMTENNNFYPPAWDNTNGANRSYAQVLDIYMHGVEVFRNAESKFIGPNKRIPVKVNSFSHPITYSMNRAVCRDITIYGNVSEKLVHATRVSRPSEVILLADGCQNPSNLGQANASAYRITAAVGQNGPANRNSTPIPVGPDADTSAGDGWFRYADGKCHALLCDGSARTFRKGEIRNGNIWINNDP